nr:hypothetical protein [Tanacetum cinerariifolium]
MQTQTSNTLLNAIKEAGGKDRPPMLALDKEFLISEGSSVTTTETYMETYKNVLQDIRDQLNVEAEAVQIILIGIENDIYSIVDACPNAFLTSTTTRMAKKQNEVNEIRVERIARNANPLALVSQQQPIYHPQNHPTHYTRNSSTRSQQVATKNREKAIVNSPPPIYDEEPSMVAEDDEMSKDKEIDKLVALISLSGAGYNNQRLGNVVGARENVGTTVVHKSGIQCYNCKKFRHVARECQKPKKGKDAAYHREKMLLYQELKAHYMYMAQIQEVSPDAADSGPIFDAEPLQK